MFSNLVEQITTQVADLAGNQANYIINKALDDLEVEKTRVQQMLLDSSTVLASSDDFNTFKKLAQTILREEATVAILNTTEFNDERGIFLNRFLEAIDDPRTLTIVPVQEGGIDVIIDLNSSAGDLEDYGNGIRLTREEIKGKNPNLSMLGDGLTRSKFWTEKLYGAARQNREIKRKYYKNGKVSGSKDMSDEYVEKYWWTISRRIELSGQLAPFWELIDKGNMTIPGSDIGGIPYPINAPTHFVDNAIRRIQESYYNYTTKNAPVEDPQLRRWLDELTDAESAVQKIKNDVSSKVGVSFQGIVNQILERMNETKRIRANVDSIRIQAELIARTGRFNLDVEGKKRFGSNVRIGLKTLESSIRTQLGFDQ